MPAQRCLWTWAAGQCCLARRTRRARAASCFSAVSRCCTKGIIRELVAFGRDVERRRPRQFHFKLTTNGLLLDEEFLDFAVRKDVLIAMSFDGTREAHDAHRRRRDGSSAYDLLLGRLRMLLEVRPYATVLMVVSPDTVKHMTESVGVLMDEGCRYLIVSLNYAADWTEADMRSLARQYRRLGRLYVDWTREGRKFYLSPFEVKLSSHVNCHCHRKERCDLARRQLSVDPAGYLYPCVQFAKAGPESRWCMGSVFDGIDEPVRARIRTEAEREKEVCSACALKERCNSSCGCLNWQSTGQVTEVCAALCRHEQMLIPIADRVGARLYRRRDPLFLHKHYNAAYPVLSLLEEGLAEEGAGERP